VEKTIAPCNWNDEHAAPSWLCLTASPATVAPRRREHLSPLIVKKSPPRAWQPSCETCSPIVAPACGKICPDLGLVNEIMERWRTA